MTWRMAERMALGKAHALGLISNDKRRQIAPYNPAELARLQGG